MSQMCMRSFVTIHCVFENGRNNNCRSALGPFQGDDLHRVARIYSWRLPCMKWILATVILSSASLQFTFRTLESFPLAWKTCEWPYKYDCNHTSVDPSTRNHHSSTFSSVVWSTASNAELRSRRTSAVTLPSSVTLITSFSTRITAVSV